MRTYEEVDLELTILKQDIKDLKAKVEILEANSNPEIPKFNHYFGNLRGTFGENKLEEKITNK